jgi:hypothetical protein
MLTSRARALRWLIEIALIVVVVAVAVPVFGRAQAKQDGDEAMWMGTAHFFEKLFIEHDISAKAWPDNYWTRTHPMVVRYIMGGWLWAHGYDLDSLDPAFDYTRKWFTNVEMGKAPGEAMLTEMRRAMRGMAILCAALMYGIVRVLAGRIGGLAAGLLFSGSPYMTLHLIRAKGETILMLFLLAALLTSIVAMKRSTGRGPSIGWGALTGVLLGLAIASKLTAILVVPAIVLWTGWAAIGGLEGLQALVRRARAGQLLTRPVRAATSALPSHDVVPPSSEQRAAVWRGKAIWGAGVLLIAGVTFLVHNPFFYPDPIGRPWLLLADRQREMAWQASVDPPRAVTTAAQRIKLVWRWSLNEDTWGDYRLRWPVEMPLALAGLAWLAFRAFRQGRGEDIWLLLWIAWIFAGVTWGLGYLLDHYFVPTASMGLVLNGLAIGWGTNWLWAQGRQFMARRHDLEQPVPAAQTGSGPAETAIA